MKSSSFNCCEIGKQYSIKTNVKRQPFCTEHLIQTENQIQNDRLCNYKIATQWTGISATSIQCLHVRIPLCSALPWDVLQLKVNTFTLTFSCFQWEPNSIMVSFYSRRLSQSKARVRMETTGRQSCVFLNLLRDRDSYLRRVS